jgi:hypothetical protein
MSRELGNFSALPWDFSGLSLGVPEQSLNDVGVCWLAKKLFMSNIMCMNNFEIWPARLWHGTLPWTIQNNRQTV